MVWSPFSPRDSQQSYPRLQFKRINSSVLSFLSSPTLTYLYILVIYDNIHLIFLLIHGTELLKLLKFPIRAKKNLFLVTISPFQPHVYWMTWLSHFSHVQLFVTLWTHYRASLSVGFPRQAYWSGLPCPPPGDLTNLGIEPMSLTSSALAARFFTSSAAWEAHIIWFLAQKF